MAPETFGIDRDMRTWQCMIALAGWLREAEIRLAETENGCDRSRAYLDEHPQDAAAYTNWRTYERSKKALERDVIKAKLMHTFFSEVNDSVSNYADEVDWPRR